MSSNEYLNWSFEEGWYLAVKDKELNAWEYFRKPDPDKGEGPGIPELQLPKQWLFANATAEVTNPHDSAAHSKFVRPEVNHKHFSQLPPEEQGLFISHGEYCLKIFKGYGAWWGILYQEIVLGPGIHRLTTAVYADLVDHYEGNKKVAAPDRLSGQLRIVWGAAASPWLLLEPLKRNTIVSEVVLTSATTMIVGIEVMCPFPINNNGMFFDNIRLEQIDETPIEECENPARVPYDRTAVLLPPYVSPADAGAVMQYAWAASHWTVLGSADDAGIGCRLKSRRVIALDPLSWGKAGDLKAFFDTHYPGVEYIEAAPERPSINLVTPTPYTLDQMKARVLAADLLTRGVKLRYPTTHQGPYVTNQFGAPGPSYSSHNGLDLRSSWRVWGDEALAAIGGKVVRAGYYSAEDWYGHQVRTQTSLADGRILLARYGHFVKGGIYVKVGDEVKAGQKLGRPDNTGNSTGDHLHLDIKIEGGNAEQFYADPGMLIGWDYTSPVKPGSIYPAGCKGFIGTQMLGSVANLFDYISLMPPVFKTVLLKSELGLYKQRVPNGHAIYRHWRPDEGDFPKRPDKQAAALAWINEFINDVAAMVRQYGFKEIWIESVNEVYDNDRLHNQNSLAFDIAFIQTLYKVNQERYPDLVFRPIVMTAGVGNPALPTEDVRQWEELLPLAKLCAENKGAFGLHSYWFADYAHPEYTDILAPFLQNRYQAFDQWLLSRGVAVNWMLVEGGPVGGTYNPTTKELHLFSVNGWKKAYSGNWQMTKEAFLKRNAELYAYGKQYGFRVFDVLFQSGSNDATWASFDVSGSNLVDLGRAIAGAGLP